MTSDAHSHSGTFGSDNVAVPDIIPLPQASSLVMPPPGQILDAAWVADASGEWTSGANWSTQVIVEVNGNPEIEDEPVEPKGAYDVALSPSGTTPFTVKYHTTDTINSLSSNLYATLDMTGGTLTMAANAGFAGVVNEHAGLIDAQDGWDVSGGFNLFAGAKLEIDAGNFAVSTGTLSGTVSGAGDLYFIGGDTFTLGAGFATTAATLELGVNGDGFGSVVNLAENLSYTGLFEIDDYSGNNAQLNLHGYTLTISGTSNLDGNVAGPGTLAVYGATNASSSGYDELNILTGATFVEHGTLTQAMNVELTGTIDIVAGGVWDIAGNGNIAPAGATGTLSNAGTFEKTIGTSISYVTANITNTGTFAATTGTLLVDGSFVNKGLISGGSVTVDGAFSGTGTIDLGTLTLNGGGTLGGTLSGTGLIDLGNGQDYMLAARTGLTAGTLEVSGGATLTLESNEPTAGNFILANASVELGKYDSSITGSASLGGTITGSATLTTSHASIDSFLALADTVTWVDSGSITQNANAQLGNSSTDKVSLVVGKGDSYAITGDYALGNPNIDDTGTATITSAGLFEMTGTSGQASIYNSDFTSTGTLLVDSALNLQGGDAVLGGKIEGAGTLVLNTAWTLDAKASVAIGDIVNDGPGALAGNASDAGSFTQYSNGTIALGGHALSLTGPAALAGDIGGTGTLTLKNAVVNDFSMYGTSTLIDSGLVSQQGSTTIGASSTDASTLIIDAHATWTVIGTNQWLGNPNQNDTGIATIDNAGVFTTSAGNSVDVWHSDLTNTGTLLANGSIALIGNSATLGGKLAGTGYLDLATGWTLESTATVTVAQLDNEGAGTLSANFSYGGTYTNGNGATLTLAGHTLDLTGPASLAGNVGSTGTMSVTDATANNFYLFGTTTLVDAGTISQTGLVWLGSGGSDAGTLDISAGATWSVTGNQSIGNSNVNDTGVSTVNNAGLFTAGAGDVLYVDHSIFTTTGTLLANGSLILYGNSATLGGTIAGAGYLDLATSWTLEPTATVSVAQLDNEGAGTLTANFSYGGTYTNGNNATLTLGGNTLGLTGPASLAGDMGSTGTLSVTDATVDNFYLFGTTTLVDAGTISQTGLVWLGSGSADSGTLDVSAGATWSVTGNESIGNGNVNDTGVSTVNNAGLFTAGAGDVLYVDHSIFTNTGTLLADGSLTLFGDRATLGGTIGGTGYLDLETGWTLEATAVVSVAQLDNEGSGTLTADLSYAGNYTNGYGATLALGANTLTLTGPASIGGTIAGAGVLLLDGGADSFTGNATITAADLGLSGGTQLTLERNLVYGGSFTVASGLGAGIALNGDTLTLTGAATLGAAAASLAVTGAGTLSLAGTASAGGVTIGGGAMLLATGVESQSGLLTLGSSAGAGTLGVSATGTWDISSNRTITTAGAGGTITNAGLFERTGNAGRALITAAFTNTGTVEVTSGSLVFTGGFTNSGTIIGTETSSQGTVTITAATPADFGFLPAAAAAGPAVTGSAHVAVSAPDWGSFSVAASLLGGHGHAGG